MSKVETNIAIVQGGIKVFVNIREAIVEGTDLSPDIIQRACRSLQFQRGIAAIPHPTEKNQLLIASIQPIKDLKLNSSDWAVQVRDCGQPTRTIHWSNINERAAVTELIERALEAQLAKHTNLWTLDSPHIWYESEPFTKKDEIIAYRRYTVGAIDVDDVGVGIIVDISTAFFSEKDLGHFFSETVGEVEQKKRQANFDRLTNRQKKQKGTLLYNIDGHSSKCYFVDAPVGKTCATTGMIQVDGISYNSLVDYYKKKYPDYECRPDARAVRVSFRNLSRPAWVAAECLQVRIMNDELPRSLKQVDKLNPFRRRQMTKNFWAQLDDRPFGNVAQGLQTIFWRPTKERVLQFALPELLFCDGQRIPEPKVGDLDAYKRHFRLRQEMLDELGCFDSPPTMPRTIHLGYPDDLSKANVDKFAAHLTGHLRRLTGRPIQTSEPIAYKSVDDAIVTLSDRSAQVVMFVLDCDPTAYYKATYDQKWHIKRLTKATLTEHISYIDTKYNRWDTFVTMNALDIAQLLGVIPFAVPSVGQYEAQLAIDVGHDRRNFALSLLIARTTGEPRFKLFAPIFPNPDPQHDIINPTILRDAIVSLFQEVLKWNADELHSLLILRDGEFRSLKEGKTILREKDGVLDSITKLKELGLLSKNANIHLADFRKQTNRTIRFWTVDNNRYEWHVENPLEGTAVIVNNHYVALATTGVTTLSQGTARPVVITSNGHCPDIIEATRSVFIAAQLNWSSPKKAQRLPQTIQAADEKLQAREAQEIRRLS